MSFSTRAKTTMIAGAVAAMVGTFAAQQVQAGEILPPELDFTLQVNGDAPIYFFPAAEQTGASTWHWGGSYQDTSWAMPLFSISADTDPMVSANISFVNNSLVTNLYTITVTLPVPGFGPSSTMGGSVGGSVTDANQDGLGGVGYGSGAPGSALFFGQIDLVNVLGLHGAPGGVAVPFAGGTSNIPAVSAGLPGRFLAAPAVVGSIGIQLQFTLSAGDSIAITSFFSVEPVPAPAGLALLGLAGLVSRRRRN